MRAVILSAFFSLLSGCNPFGEKLAIPGCYAVFIVGALLILAAYEVRGKKSSQIGLLLVVCGIVLLFIGA